MTGLRAFAGALVALAVAAAARTGEGQGPAERIDRAIEAARAGDVIGAASLAREVFGGVRSDEAAGAGVRELRLLLESGATELVLAVRERAPARASAAWALGWTGRSEAALDVAGLLTDPEVEVRREAATALASIGPAGRSPPGGDGRRRPAPDEARSATRQPGPVPNGRSRGPEASRAAVIGALVRAVGDGDAGVRAAALDALRRLGAGGRAGLEALTDGSERVRLAAAMLVAEARPGTLDGHEAETPLLGALGDTSPVVRAAAATALGTLGTEAAARMLARAARDPDAGVAAAAVEALGDAAASGDAAAVSGRETAEAALVELAGSADGGLALRATEALGRTGARKSDVVDALARLLRDAPTEIAAAAAKALGSVGGESAKEALVSASSREDVRLAVAVAAARLGEFRPSAALLRGLDDADPWLRLSSARGLAETGNPAGFPVFLEALASDDEKQRGYAAACLAIFTNVDLEYRPDDPPEARERLVQAWGRWWRANRETFEMPREGRAEAR